MSTDDEKSLSFATLLTEFKESEAPVRGALIYFLSEPASADFEGLKAVWESLAVEKRQVLMSCLLETSESSFDVDFSDVALFALEDTDDLVRKIAVETLWTNEEPETMRSLIWLVENDESPSVRAAAAEALGQFVLNGELGELEELIANEAEEFLITILVSGSEPLEVQRRALESLAYSSRDEVAKQIRRAHSSDIIEMQASAIFAMGRSADNIWDEDVLAALGEDLEAPLLYEAAKAAGELLLRSSIDRLIDLMLTDDREIRDAAIWSLGEIGGRTAQNALTNLVKTTEDEDLIEALEDAIANAQLVEGDFSMFAFDSELDDFEE